MRLRNIPAARGALESSGYVIKNPGDFRGVWRGAYEGICADTPLMIEIGMGKGRFLLELSQRHPDSCYIGMEYQSSVLYRGLQKLEKDPRTNVLLLREDAARLPEIFAPGELDGIYLNFSDPWPKEKHEKRRLTSGVFLSIYEVVLKTGGFLEFKTDNRGFFDYSVSSINASGWEIAELTYDLHGHRTQAQGNILTEYEEKFSLAGHPICKISAVRP